MTPFRHRIRAKWVWPVVTLLLALALRLLWVQNPGCIADVSFFVPWMRQAAQGGAGQVYSASESSYPPLSVYVLWLLGQFGAVPSLSAPPTLTELLALRAASTTFDLLMVALLYRIGRRLTGHRVAAAGALLYALCPGDIYLSGWWIQIESWFVLPLVLGTWWLSQGRVAHAWAALGVAMALKLQAAFLLPVFLTGTWRWWGMRRLVAGSLALALVLGVVVAPLIPGRQVAELFSKTIQPAQDFPWISSKSHNLWFALTPRARALGSDTNRDQNAFVGGISYHDAGLALMALGYGLVLARLFVRSGPFAIFAACIVGWFMVFMLLTRVHARYLFPTQALMLCAGFSRRRWWALYGPSAATLFVNLSLRACEISPLTCVLAVPVTPEGEAFSAWTNIAVWGFTLLFYLTPVFSPAQHQANHEGTLSVIEGKWELTLFGAVAVVLLGVVGAVLWRGRTIGAQIAPLQPALRASLEASLVGTKDSEKIVVVNWPGAIAASRSAYLLDVVPVTPPALFMTGTDIVARDATWVQYLPWQKGVKLEMEPDARPNTELEIGYYGTYITQAELATLVQQAERTVVFSPYAWRTIVLADYVPSIRSSECPVSLAGRICLLEAGASWLESALQIDLTWQVTGTAVADETVFVHVIDIEGNLIAQADGHPAGNLVPLAGLSRTERALYETRLVTVPPDQDRGGCRVLVGLYATSSGERLAVHCRSSFSDSGSNVCRDDGLEIVPPSSEQ